MKVNSITTKDIPEKTVYFNEKYGELFTKALALCSGNGFSVEPDEGEKAATIANCVRNRLKNIGIVDKYIIAIRNNVLYVCKK